MKDERGNAAAPPISSQQPTHNHAAANPQPIPQCALAYLPYQPAIYSQARPQTQLCGMKDERGVRGRNTHLLSTNNMYRRGRNTQ